MGIRGRRRRKTFRPPEERKKALACLRKNFYDLVSGLKNFCGDMFFCKITKVQNVPSKKTGSRGWPSLTKNFYTLSFAFI